MPTPKRPATTASDAPDDASLFYYANGRRVPITPSARYVAVKGRGRALDASGAPSALGDALGSAPGGAFGGAFGNALGAETLTIPEYDLAVVTMPTGAAGAAGGAPGTPRGGLRAALADVAAGGPTVYEAADDPTGEGLVPVGEIIVRFRDGMRDDDVRAVLRTHGLTETRRDYPEPGARLVRADDADTTIPTANALQERDDVEYAQPNFVHLAPRVGMSLDPLGDAGNGGAATADAGAFTGSFTGTGLGPDGVGRYGLADAGVMDRALDEESVAIHPAVEPAGEGARRPVQAPAAGPAAPTLNDPLLASQYALTRVRALEAFDITMGNASVVVAVLDEGCDVAHEDINYRLPGYNALDRNDNPQPAGNDAHGTACAGIVSMRANNLRGGVGIAPNCPTLPVRIARGIGGGRWFTTDAIVADAIRTAVARGAAVLSNSYSVGDSTVVTNAFRFAQTSGRGGLGCCIAAAAGNDDMRGIIYPARLSPTIPGMVAVGASNRWDQRKSRTSADGETWWGSNWGPELDLVAPGVGITTTDISGTAGYGTGHYVTNFNGTSSATPFVAGLMALVLSVDPALRGWEVEDILKLTAQDLGTAGRDEQFGFGRIDARRALEAAQRIAVAISVTPVFLGTGRDCYIRVAVRVTNPGINAIRLNALTLTSHAPDGTEIDRFTIALTPGGVMQPRTTEHVQAGGILLRANGNASSWSFRWNASWGYTFWRPSAAIFPLGADRPTLAPIAVDSARSEDGRGEARGAFRGGTPVQPGGRTNGTGAPNAHGAMTDGATVAGDSVVVDRQSRSITITIR